LTPSAASIIYISRNAHRLLKTAPARGTDTSGVRNPHDRGRDVKEDSLIETPAWTYRHTTIRIATGRPTEFIDLTDRLEALVAEAGMDTGLVNIQSLHTTTAIVVNEHEPLLLGDFSALLQHAAPIGASYRHDDFRVRTINMVPGERSNGHAHCRALLLGASTCLNVAGGRLQRGRWQRVFLAELDGPRVREVSIMLVGGGGR
jgi:secondary thiamine-phosphate synthase enzyme